MCRGGVEGVEGVEGGVWCCAGPGCVCVCVWACGREGEGALA